MWIALLAVVPAALADTGGTYALGKKVDQVVVASARGRIDVVVDPGLKRPEVVVEDRMPGRYCAVEVSEERGVGRLTFAPKALESVERCLADLEVRVPPRVRVTLELGEVDVTLRAMTQPVKVTLAKGRVRADRQSVPVDLVVTEGDVVLSGGGEALTVQVTDGSVTGAWEGPVTASIQRGPLTLAGLTGKVEADVGVGNVRLELATLVPDGVMVKVGNGHTAIAVPGGSKVRCGLVSHQGTVTCDAADDEAGVPISVLAGIGSIRVH